MIRALVDLAAELLLHVSTSLTADDEANNATRRIDNAASEVPDFNVDWLGIREIISLDISPKITPPPLEKIGKFENLHIHTPES